MTTNTENKTKIMNLHQRISATLMAGWKTTTWGQKSSLMAARDHCIEALRALSNNDNDTAGRHLEAARRCILEARA